MTNLPLISIIIPVYKVEKYLDKCVQSVQNQTYTNLEIILVDDGSPDNCGKICDGYTQNDPRIKVIHKKNGGLADARNAAIDIAAGEWFVFIDSDDYVEPNHVETLYTLIQKYNCKLACSNFRHVYENDSPSLSKENHSYSEKIYSKWEALQSYFLQTEIGCEAWGKIYHRSLWTTGIKYPFGLIYEDLPTTYLLILKTEKIAYCNKQTYNYLLRPTSLEGASFNSKKSESAVKIIESIQGHFNELAPILPAVKSRLFSLAMHVLLAMPDDYNGEDKDYLIDYIKKNRLAVLSGKTIRPRARFAALLSFGGTTLCKSVFSKMKGNVTLRRSKAGP